MKNLLILLIYTSLIYCQQWRVVESNFHILTNHGLALQSNTEYTYNDIGELLYYVTCTLDQYDYNLKPCEKSIVSQPDQYYDSAMIFQYWDQESESWIDSLRSQWKWFEDDRNYYNHAWPHEGKWRTFAFNKHELNSDGLIVADTSYQGSESNVRSYWIDSSYYDDQKRIVQKVRFEVRDNKRKNIYRGTYSYDDSRGSYVILHQNWDSTGWYDVHRDQYTISSDTTTKINQRFVDSVWTTKSRTVTISRNKSVHYEEEFEWYLNEWRSEKTTKREFNSKGKETLHDQLVTPRVGYRSHIKRYIEYKEDTLALTSTNVSWTAFEQGGRWDTVSVSVNKIKTLEQIVPIVQSKAQVSTPKISISNTVISLPQKAQELQIYNLHGQLVRTIPAKTKGEQSSFTLPTDLSNAAYILKVFNTENSTSVQPFIHTF